MRLSGAITLAIGLVLRELSPVKTEKKGLPERTPDSRRIVVPELPQSITSRGSDKPYKPFPRIVRVGPSSIMSIPRRPEGVHGAERIICPEEIPDSARALCERGKNDRPVRNRFVGWR